LGRDRLQFEPRCGDCVPQCLRGDPTMGKIALAHADAAHVQAFHRLRLAPFAKDQFGASATNVQHQPRGIVGQLAGHTLINEAGFLAPGDHLDRMAQRGLRTHEEFFCLTRAAQRVGTHHPDTPRCHAAQPLPESFKASQRAALRRLGNSIVFIHPGGEPHHLLQAVQHMQLAGNRARHDHMEAVRPEVDGRDDIRGRSRFTTPLSCRRHGNHFHEIGSAGVWCAHLLCSDAPRRFRDSAKRCPEVPR